MDKTTRQFFELLKSGLWGKPVDARLFAGKVNWQSIYAMAEKQTVIGVCFDGIELLPKNCLPDMDLLMDWLGQVEYLATCNEQLNEGIVEVVSRYNTIGLHPVLLKGQGVGQYYRKPNHRCSGDIDLYFAEGIERANELTATWDGVEFEESTESHTGFKWNGFSVENHHKYVKFVSNKNKKAWEEVESEVPLVSESFKFQASEGFCVPVPQPQINVLYVFIHLMHHLLQVGVGLRQVCDWFCLWKACEGQIEKQLFLKHVDMLPVRRCMTALTWIGVNYMGFDKGIIPLDIDTEQACKDGELLLNDILKTGNFGHDTEIMKGFKRNHHINNLKSYFLAARRMMKIHCLCPSELNAYPWHWLRSKITVGDKDKR